LAIKEKEPKGKGSFSEKCRSSLWEYLLDYKNRYNQGAQPQNPLAQRKTSLEQDSRLRTGIIPYN